MCSKGVIWKVVTALFSETGAVMEPPRFFIITVFLRPTQVTGGS